MISIWDVVIRNLKYVYFYLQYMAVYTVHVPIFCLAANVVREDLLDNIVFISWYPLLVPGQPHWHGNISLPSIVNFFPVFPFRASYHADFTQHTYTFCTWNFSFFLFFTCTHPCPTVKLNAGRKSLTFHVYSSHLWCLSLKM